MIFVFFFFFGNFTKELRYFSLNVSVTLRVGALFNNFSFTLGIEFLKTLEIEGSKSLEKAACGFVVYTFGMFL